MHSRMDAQSEIVDVSESASGNVAKIALDDMYEDGTVDPVYQAKARVLNNAIQEIGMGKYQIHLFICAGFGWFADSVWPLITGLILTQVTAEFKFNGPLLTLAANIGLLVGAIVWSVGCDIWGRRWSFNLTLLIAGVFGLSAGGSPNFITLASLLAVVGVGVGGNMPVDSAVFLDLVPGTHQYLLTVMSVWWSLGQLLCSLLAWPLIANYSCPEDASVCERSQNMGWRYLLFTLGGITLLLWCLRFFLFTLVESPRFLVGIGRDAEAVSVIHKVAKYNSTSTGLSVEQLNQAAELKPGSAKRPMLSRTSVYGLEHVKALFSTRKVAISTTLLIALWGIIGLASTLYNSFLPYLLTSRGADFGDGSLFITYRNQFILSVIGIPGAFLAGWAVELPHIGRRGTLAISSGEWSVFLTLLSLFNDPSRKTGLTGAFLFASTTARNSNALLGWNCGYVFNSNIMYGVLYAVSAEIFPAKHRGTGNGLVSTATRVFGVIAPIIALYADIATSVPVYIAGALILFAGALAMLLPYEPRGKASI
ncbi:MFS general substrate transporter [Desarmillaria tabescens]|uniref:MFS general substrate transporter n=1 Tax=Armillaria tabescens TaxID=1929756 RepID=A0AA39MTB0_ARMTA|nr:MFS general substrate transporter [Desarmillaria tabescens]KAK0445025.1 MFS general substrate transporter [Desarmillaria tabescens]